MSGSLLLKDRLAKPDIIVVPGVYDCLSGLLAVRAGFEALFLSGSAVAYSQLARPDIGLITMNEMADVCARLTDRVDVPVLADIDSGFGNAVHASRSIRALELAGAAAVQVEDQVPIKSSSNFTGRPLVSLDTMVDKIKAMVDSRRNSNTLISARTDSPFSEPLETVLERMSCYKAAGADILFAEGLKSESEVSAVAEIANGVPILYNLLKVDGKILSATQLESLGVSIALFPGNAILNCFSALSEAFSMLKNNPVLSPDLLPVSTKELNEVLGVQELHARYKDCAG